MSNPTWEESKPIIPKWEDSKPIGEKQSFMGGISRTLSNFPKSAMNYGKALMSTPQLLNPMSEEAKNAGNIVLGTLSKVGIPGLSSYKPYAEAVGKLYIDRYGSFDKLVETSQTDPVGFAADASTVFSGLGGIATKAGQVSKISSLGKAGEFATTAAKSTEPISLVTGIGGKTIKGISSPFSKMIDKPVIKAATEQGMDISNLPTSMVSKSYVPTALEAISGKGFFGGKTIDAIDMAGQNILKQADDIVVSTGKSSDLGIAGNSVFKGMQDFKNRWMNIKNSLYDEADISYAPKVDTSNTLSKLDDIILRKESASKILGESVPGKTFFEDIRSRLSKPGIKSTDVKNALRELNKMDNNFNDPIATGNRAELKSIITTLDNDFTKSIEKTSPMLYEKLTKADEYYKQGIEKLNSAYGDKIFNYKDNPSKIIPSILNPNTPVENIPKIYEVIGKDNISQVQSAFLGKIFEEAKSPETGVFYPQKLNNIIKKYGDDKLMKILTPEQYNATKNIALLSSKLGKVQKVMAGSQTAFVGKIAGYTALGALNPKALALTILGDAAGSVFINSTIGKQWLTSGVPIGMKTGDLVMSMSNKTTPYSQLGFQAGRISLIRKDNPK